MSQWCYLRELNRSQLLPGSPGNSTPMVIAWEDQSREYSSPGTRRILKILPDHRNKRKINKPKWNCRVLAFIVIISFFQFFIYLFRFQIITQLVVFHMGTSTRVPGYSAPFWSFRCSINRGLSGGVSFYFFLLFGTFCEGERHETFSKIRRIAKNLLTLLVTDDPHLKDDPEDDDDAFPVLSGCRSSTTRFELWNLNNCK